MSDIGERLDRLSRGYAAGQVTPEDYVQALYALLLGREVDPDSLAYYLALPSLDGLAAILLTSIEFTDRWRSEPGFHRRAGAGKAHRILLFGAYGNGNLGDRIQPAVLARLIAGLRPDIDVWACSQLPAAFDFPMDRVLPAAALGNRHVLESFDLLLIGGGGLLAHPHDPLIDPYWQAHLPCPVALFGIGARAPAVGMSEALVRAAATVTGRDRTSVALLSGLRADGAGMVADPVLCDPSLERTQRGAASGESILWVLKQEDIDASAAMLARIDRERDRICFLEPHRDYALVTRWPTARPIYRLDELVPLIDASDAVVSMRYHGAILAILRDVPVFAVGEDKSAELLERFDAAAAYHRTGDTFDRRTSPLPTPRARLRAERTAFLGELGALLEREC